MDKPTTPSEQRIIDRLKEGPLTDTSEVNGSHNSFLAQVTSLRKKGYVIKCNRVYTLETKGSRKRD